MPIYEYRCLNPECEKVFEIMAKMSDPPPSCPDCAQAHVRKLISVASFACKGGGWAKDGYQKPTGTGS
jgi:putative FmdB family regulatory protein